MKPIRQIDTFMEDEEGATLVLWGVMFILLFGLVAMSFDMGRIGVTRSELQSYADHVALAAAGELDGELGARDRATQAAEDLIQDFQTYGSGGHLLSGAADFTITFHNNLPDKLLGATQFVALGDEDAEYVRVQVTQQTVPLTFANAFAAMTGGTPPNNTANAFAVAGMSSYTCNALQIFFCLPEKENADGTTTPGDESNLQPGAQILLVAGDAGDRWGAGNWGFISEESLQINPSGPCGDLIGKGTGPLLRCVLGAMGPIAGCIKDNTFNTETGKKKGITGNSINTRFDRYWDSMNNADQHPENIYAPAPIITSNQVHNSLEEQTGKCLKKNDFVDLTELDPSIDTETMGFPRDECFYDGDCQVGNDFDPSGRFGEPNTWDVTAYLEKNYGSVDNAVTALGFADAASILAANRYDIYVAEIDNLTGTGGIPHAGSPVEQSGLPQCNTPATSSGPVGAERREMLAAGVYCGAHDGYSGINGSETGVRSEMVIRFFITEPVDVDSSSLDIWGEIIEVIPSNDPYQTSIFREVPQLVD
ncbi:pilus assembly protein TadG-related protein [Ovoidimarina sediminis]|uniref:pilus assembly protein TadG-related protein n=1 Tax=Ovoidimarina sediminis TaxID=3079856 RepID=UPI00290FF5E9|nr:pilus assembly protein TadG-related protein [Rhodophyticola sp. MJ-SS7]MDU8946027.1 pilus assembly protein TadG-related protein [Rhodophyticola sp. MJ-SS7]